MGQHPPSKFYRLALDHHIAPNYDRVLYLDSDTLVQRSLEPLLETELYGLPLGAVLNLADLRASLQDRPRDTGAALSREDYRFNSGVVLFDWRKTLDADLIGEVRRHLSEKTYPKLADQDALNIVLANRWFPLPLNFNVTKIAAGLIASPVIRHFNGRQKPWRASSDKHDASARDSYRTMLGALGAEDLFERDPRRWAHMMRETLRRAIEPLLAARRKVRALPPASAETGAFQSQMRHSTKNRVIVDFLTTHFPLGEDGLHRYRLGPEHGAMTVSD
jgi:lipopolysaccharide biosynthesis glycosyltransferase